MSGKKIRIERLMDRNSKKTVMVPLIHGVGMGPIEGIKKIKNVIDMVALGGANAVILHKGIVRTAHRRSGKDIGLILHLTATSENGRQTLVTDVEEAMAIGADGVSVRIEVGGHDEEAMLRMLGRISRDARYKVFKRADEGGPYRSRDGCGPCPDPLQRVERDLQRGRLYLSCSSGSPGRRKEDKGERCPGDDTWGDGGRCIRGICGQEYFPV